MSSLMSFADVDGASNDFHDISRGIKKENYDYGYDDDGKPYCKVKRFANNFDSKLSHWKIGQKPEERYVNKKVKLLLESALELSNPAKRFVSKEIQAEKFKPIYGKEFKKLLWDMYLNDYIAAEGVNIRAWAGFANQTNISLMPVGNKEYQSSDELETDLTAAGYSEQEQRKTIAYIEKVNEITDFRYYQQDLVKQSMVGGLAGLFIEIYEKQTKINDITIPKTTPAIIKPLHWSYFDQVRVDTATWKFDSVRYTDFEDMTSDGPAFIPGNRLIYITRNDHQITPNNLFYGISDFHSIWKLSNIIRQAEEIDLPEIVTSMWSQPGVFKFRNMNIDEIDEFMASVTPGSLRGFNANVDFIPVPLKHDGWFLLTLLQNSISHMLMKLRVPEFLFAFGGKNVSRSDVEIQMNVFRDVVLSGDRWSYGRHFTNQWYNNLLMLDAGVKDPNELKVKVVQNYVPLSFEDILAKANSLELLVRRYFIDIHEGRQYLGLKPYNKNIDSKVNPIGQLLDISPVEKIKFDQTQQLAEQRAQQAQQQQQTTMDQFARQTRNVPGQEGFHPPHDRANSARIGTPGAGRGNTT